MTKKIIVLTDAEHRALKMIIENGWGDGDFAGWGGTRKNIQISAMDKFKKPFNTFLQAIRHQKKARANDDPGREKGTR